jgi:transglutaminase superfamily protein
MLTWQSLHRGGRLTALTTHAWLGLAAFDIALAMGFARAHGLARARADRAADRLSAGVVDDIVWAVDEACVWYVKRAACLQRSAVLVRLLRRRGARADLVIGYRPLPFESHAWVEIDGRVVNDSQQYRTMFAVLERL